MSKKKSPEPAFLADPELSATAKAILAILWRRGFRTSRIWALSQKDLAAMTGKSLATIKRALRALRRRGYIGIDKKGGGRKAGNYATWRLLAGGAQLSIDFGRPSRPKTPEREAVRKAINDSLGLVENLGKNGAKPVEPSDKYSSKMTPISLNTAQKCTIYPYVVFCNKLKKKRLESGEPPRDQ